MARFYSNENFPQQTVEELRKLGHDVLTSVEAGKANRRIPDDEVLGFAAALERAVLTLNRKHFKRLHAKNATHCGMVLCTQDRDSVGQAQRIHARVTEHTALNGRLLQVHRPG